MLRAGLDVYSGLRLSLSVEDQSAQSYAAGFRNFGLGPRVFLVRFHDLDLGHRQHEDVLFEPGNDCLSEEWLIVLDHPFADCELRHHVASTHFGR